MRITNIEKRKNGSTTVYLLMPYYRLEIMSSGCWRLYNALEKLCAIGYIPTTRRANLTDSDILKLLRDKGIDV